MQLRTLLIAAAALAATAPTPATALAATPQDGTYVGKTSEGRTVKVKVSDRRVDRAVAIVNCGGERSFAETGDGPIRRLPFSLDDDHILSGTGGESETIHSTAASAAPAWPGRSTTTTRRSP